MNKLAEAAFVDELIKIALNLADARTASKLLRPKIIRRGFAGNALVELEDVGGGEIINSRGEVAKRLVAKSTKRGGDINSVRKKWRKETFHQMSDYGREKALDYYKTYGGRIYQPRGGVIKNILNRARANAKAKVKDKGEEQYEVLAKHIGRMSPEEKEMTNRIALLHEGSEMSLKDHKTHQGFKSAFNHMGPGVIEQESNMIATIPRKYPNVKSFYTTLRNLGREPEAMGIRYGARRIKKSERSAILSNVNLSTGG